MQMLAVLEDLGDVRHQVSPAASCSSSGTSRVGLKMNGRVFTGLLTRLLQPLELVALGAGAAVLGERGADRRPAWAVGIVERALEAAASRPC